MRLSRLVTTQVALCLLCLFLLSAFMPTSALPGRGKGIGSHRSSSGSRSSSHSTTSDKKHGLGSLFSSGDKKDDKKDKSTSGKGRKPGSSPGRQGKDDSRGRGSSRGSSRGSNRGSSRGSSHSNPFSDRFDLDNPFSDAHAAGDIFAVEDGPTKDKKPGIGVEFESSGVKFANPQPFKGKKGAETVTIGKAKQKHCQKWTVEKPANEGAIANIGWQYQVTVPMPLGAIHDLFRKARSGENTPLLPGTKMASKGRMIWVNKNFFQANPEGNSPDQITPDAMGFLSLVVSYAKNAETRNPEESPKMLTPIMPRTDFASIYNDVKSDIKGDLYKLVSVLLCYKNDEGDEVEFDSMACDGDAKNPKPKKSMDETTELHLKGENPETERPEEHRVRLKEWMNGLPRGQDILARGDAVIDGQVGGLKSAHEEVYRDSKRLVPLFEFRNLGSVQASGFKRLVEKIEDAVLDYHKRF
ncbi:hypothetical protein P170DRAFT_427091 [Aspergillus steynii IBT 23096]|uniref:Uncharacterized protein n=1 Tax=Aspergillus steynii IBT 23096 TaxID=1392250 RepID=A0A2I2G4W0_9EURO|nr:uncharacterized protein P170DRAFT_427091 [Aspergillus steynii IBT 23096]PLB47919.1 hypothetical protein P170DRAFT_427091 [Aspergillus steynii IBT 23096]